MSIDALALNCDESEPTYAVFSSETYGLRLRLDWNAGLDPRISWTVNGSYLLNVQDDDGASTYPYVRVEEFPGTLRVPCTAVDDLAVTMLQAGPPLRIEMSFTLDDGPVPWTPGNVYWMHITANASYVPRSGAHARETSRNSDLSFG